MTSRTPIERLLTVGAAADRMSTSVRFVRRLITERRIEFVKVGRHVRISEAARRVEPMTVARVRPTQKGVA